jgi:methionine-S-sulfoxide reductase
MFMKNIWLAGGCFWGVEEYFSRIKGVTHTSVGYSNGRTDSPTYKELAQTGHCEAVQVTYDQDQISLAALLDYYFRIIDPTSLNKQGGDVGTQYRTGIYYDDEDDLAVIGQMISKEQAKYTRPIVTEVKPLEGYYPAEDYHQEYLKKNPGGYCHVDFSLLEDK